MLGANTPDGLPLELFTSGEARWLEIRGQGLSAQSRVLLVSVPYAIKAHEAETLAGRSISDFVLNEGNTASAGASDYQVATSAQGALAQSSTSAKAVGPTNFVGSNATQIVKVTQTGTGSGISARTSSTKTNAAAVNASETATTGQVYGVQGAAASPSGVGVIGTAPNSGVNGVATATTGVATGVYGQVSAPAGNGVAGFALATTGTAAGVYGQTASSSNGATAVYGNSSATTGYTYGVQGAVASPNGVGVQGVSTNTTGGNGVSGFSNAASGNGIGVYGQSNSTSGNAVIGNATASSGVTFGVQGFSTSPSGVGVQGSSPNVAVAGINQVCGSNVCQSVVGTAGEFVTASGGTVLSGINGTTLAGIFSVDASGNGFFAGNLDVSGTITGAAGVGGWYTASNVTLSTSSTNVIQTQIDQAGSYIFTAQLTLNRCIPSCTGSFQIATCYIQAGSTSLPPSMAQDAGITYTNMSVLGAVTLTNANLPATVSLICSENETGFTVAQAALTIVQVGTLQTGPLAADKHSRTRRK